MKKGLISKEVLKREYIDKEKPMHQIAEEHGIAIGTVYNYAKEYGIQGRKHLTEKTRQHMAEIMRGRPGHRKGIHLSEETKNKLRLAHRGKYTKPSKYGGHRKKHTDGYIKVYCPDHPHHTKDGYVMEHILVMEKAIGRHLKPDEVVHHINKDRKDNRIENLQLMTFKEHASFHMKERHAEKRGVKTYQ